MVDRVQVLYRFKALLEKHADDVAAILTRENGKTIDDARAEVRRAIQMVEVACGMPSLMMGDSLNDVARGHRLQNHPPAHRRLRRHHAVQFSGHGADVDVSVRHRLRQHVRAEAVGKSAADADARHRTAARCRDCRAGVLNLVHGGKEAVDALLHHPLVKAVSFVGSTPVAKYIYTTAAAEGKRVQALGGAKNHLVVMPDADMPKTVEAIIGSAFGAAGERCLAGSVLVPVGDAAGPLLELLVEAHARRWPWATARRAAWKWGRWSPPIIAREWRAISKRASPKAPRRWCDGRASKPASGGFFLGPTIFDNVTPEMTIAKEEIFGPVLSVMRVKTLDDAIKLVNRSPFGNATSIFTSNGKSAREYSSRIEVGMVGVNVGVAAPMAFFPFAGWKNSFFGDLHAHGKDAVAFYTEQKVIMSRWF